MQIRGGGIKTGFNTQRSAALQFFEKLRFLDDLRNPFFKEADLNVSRFQSDMAIRGARVAPSSGKATGASPSTRLWRCFGFLVFKVIFLLFRDEIPDFSVPGIGGQIRNDLQIIG